MPATLNPKASLCFTQTLHPTQYRTAIIPRQEFLSGVSKAEILKKANIFLTEKAEETLLRLPKRDALESYHCAVLLRSADLLPRERSCEVIREKSRQFGLSHISTSLVSDFALHVSPREMHDLGVKWLVFMHHRIKISPGERGYFVLAITPNTFTLTACKGASRWAEGVAFLLTRTSEVAPSLQCVVPHDHAEPSY